MPVFNIAGVLGKGKKSGSTYNALSDLLAIRENMLASDGNLSPGDYDLLIKEAQQLRSNPGITNDQRSNIDVKISSYKKEKSVKAIDRRANTGDMNTGLENDNRISTLVAGNNPAAYLAMRVKSLGAYLSQAADAINEADAAGEDTGTLTIQYDKLLSEFQDTQKAYESASTYNNEAQPTSDYTAYISTNSKGEITDVSIGKFGAKSGYLRTNAIYGGMQVWGKPNAENKFVLGDTAYKPRDIMLPDPTNPLAPGYKVLLPENTADKDVQSVVSTGNFGSFTPIDLNKVRPQTFTEAGGWVKGMNGAYYQDKGNGTYKKYVNVKDPALISGFDPSNVLPVPKNYEDLIGSQSDETIDGAALAGPSLPVGFVSSPQQSSTPAPSTTPSPAQGAPMSYAPEARTSAPVSRAPQTAKGLAGQTIDKAKAFLGKMFG